MLIKKLKENIPYLNIKLTLKEEMVELIGIEPTTS